MDDYQRTIRTLSDRIVLAQTPIRVLDAVKWDDSIRQGFLKAKGKAMPAVDRDYYLGRPLTFDSAAVKSEFQSIERDITRQLGQFNPVGQIMRRMCKEYRMVVRMLEARGTEDFGLISQELYGAASDAFHAGDPTLADLGLMMSDYLDNIDGRGALKDEAKTLTAKDAVHLLQSRLNKVFGEAEETIRVFESDGIVADAAAGADYIKIRSDAMFNERDVRALEVHEGLGRNACAKRPSWALPWPSCPSRTCPSRSSRASRSSASSASTRRSTSCAITSKSWYGLNAKFEASQTKFPFRTIIFVRWIRAASSRRQ